MASALIRKYWYAIGLSPKQGVMDDNAKDVYVNQSIANILVDFAWGSGPVTAIRYIQKHVLSVPADGICGPVTLAAINQFPNQQLLFDMIKDTRLFFIDQLVEKNPSQKVFLKGWRNRINSFKFEPTITK